jgi:Tfp pilus assembly protein PilF
MQRGTMLLILVLLPAAGCVMPPLNELSNNGGRSQDDPKAAQSFLTAADALEREGRNAEAIAKYEQARRSDPTLRTATQHLALLYDREGRDQQALVEYQRLLKEQPNDSQLLNDFGVFHYDRERWGDAEALFRNALACDSKNQRAWVNLGRTLGQQQRYQESYAAFARAIRPAEAHSNVAVLMAHHGQIDQARLEVNVALSLDPQLQQARAVLATLNRAGSNEGSQIAHQE